jgi:hypothetical protein
MICDACNRELAEEALTCPHCRHLVHGAELQALAQRARAAWRVGKFAEERALWEQSIKLLPQDSVQFSSIQARIAELDQQAQAAFPAPAWKKASQMGIGPALVLLLTKGNSCSSA